MQELADPLTTNPVKSGLLEQFKGIANLFVSPSKTFAGVVANRWWVIPFLLCVLAAMIYGAKTSHFRMEDLKADIRSDPGNSPDEVQRRIANIDGQMKPHITVWLLATSTAIVAAAHGVKVFGLALVIWLALQLTTARVRYMVLVSTTAFIFLVKIPEAVLMAPLIIFKGTSRISLSPVVFLPFKWYGSPLYRLLSTFDIFSIWMGGLLVFALPIVAGISTKKSVMTVGYLWGIWALGHIFLGNLVGIT
ncbi:MAG: YIP1 family protein [Candidatus Zixiibacteriota bacterium]